MRLFILLFLISVNASARDCLKEYFQYSIGLKFTYTFNDLYETHRDNFDLSKQCTDKKKNELWDSEMKAMRAGVLQYKEELARSHKISSGDLHDLNTEESHYISESEICVKLDRAIKEKEDCYHPVTYSNTLKSNDILSMNFEQSCKKLGPEILRRIKICKYKN